MKIQYAKPETSDANSMFTLFQQLKKDGNEVTFTHVGSVEEVKKWLEVKNNDLYIARYNQEVIGVMRAKRGVEDTFHSCEITIAVSSEYRRQGVAKSLVLYGLSDSKHQGISIARAFVYSDNKASLNTLLSVGFTITGALVKHHYSHHIQMYVDDIILFKELM